MFIVGLQSVDCNCYRYCKVDVWYLMMGMNLWSVVYMVLFMFLVLGGGGYDVV